MGKYQELQEKVAKLEEEKRILEQEKPPVVNVQTTNHTKRNTIIIVLLLLLGVLAISWVKQRNSRLEKEDLLEAMTAELEVWKDKDGLNRARIQTMETYNARDFLALTAIDSTMSDLQDLVREYRGELRRQGSAAIIASETRVDTVYVPTDAVIDSTRTILSNRFSDEWLDLDYGFKFDTGLPIGLGIDSTNFNLTLRNRYSVVFGREKQGFLGLGRSKPFAEVKNYNPYTTTTDLRTYQVKLPPPKRFGIGPVVAYGIGPNGQVGWFIGVGASWTPIQF